TLTASDASLGVGSSGAFAITPAAPHHLGFGVQPGNTLAGVAVGPAVTVEVFDQFGNLVTGDNSNVTVAIGTNSGSGTRSGTKTQPASGGIATFGDLSIDRVGSGYTLAASDASLGAGTSAFFNITPAAADHLAFAQQPSDVQAGHLINPAVTVRVLD